MGKCFKAKKKKEKTNLEKLYFLFEFLQLTNIHILILQAFLISWDKGDA